MLKVRRTMTEILLNVTNREIQQICKEELQRYFIKNKGIVKNNSHCDGVIIKTKQKTIIVWPKIVCFHLCETVIAYSEWT